MIHLGLLSENWCLSEFCLLGAPPYSRTSEESSQLTEQTAERCYVGSVVCQEFRSVGSVRERPGGHLRMRVSPKWGLRGVGRVGKTVII